MLRPVMRGLPSRVISRSSTSHSGTFVSKHYEADPVELRELISTSFKDYRSNASTGVVEIKQCFSDCPRERKGMHDNAWKLNIRTDGSYYCYRCSSGGNWYQLKRRAHGNGKGLEIVSMSRSSHNQKEASSSSGDAEAEAEEGGGDKRGGRGQRELVLPDQEAAFAYHQSLVAAMSSPAGPSAGGEEKDSAAAAVSLSPGGVKDKLPSPQARQRVLHYLRATRGLSDEVLLRYGVGVGVQAWMDDTKGNEWVDKATVTFPWMVRAPPGSAKLNTITRVKHRAVDSKGLQRILPKGGGWGFFGWHVVRDSHTEIIITEGEYDAMAVAQGLQAAALPDSHPLKHVPAVSLPNGCNSLPPDLLPLLERFSKIYLWLDNDKSGQDAAEKYARKLGVGRCVIVRPIDGKQAAAASTAAAAVAPKDANDALRLTLPAFAPAGQSPQPATLIRDMLLAAKPLAHRRLETFAHLREQVLRNIRTPLTELSGTGTPSIPTISAIIKGFRRGELTILTGPTGGGKTTLLSQMSVDFAKAGVPTLWGSFEIKNARLVEKQLQQYYKGSGSLRSLSPEKLETLADDFESLPLHYMNFHSSTELPEILDAMDFAVYRDDTQHIIIDNLQFLLPRTTGTGGRGGSNFDKLSAQDSVLDEFRKFATEKNVNIILVIHPRKEDEGVALGMSSIFGTAKATQEADVVLILQRNAAGLAVAVKKNRYCGTLGRVDLGYNPTSSVFFELSKQEAEERAKIAKESNPPAASWSRRAPPSSTPTSR